jgi:signal peptidase I
MSRRNPRPGLVVLAAIAFVLLIKTFVIDAAVVGGRSMLPRLAPGEIVLVLRCAYGLRLPEGARYILSWSPPRPGQVVAGIDPSNGKAVVKRVAAVGPVSLRMEGGRLLGPGLDLDIGPDSALRFEKGLELPAGSLFLLGDNLPESLDSRDYGAVELESLRGRVLLFPRWAGE